MKKAILIFTALSLVGCQRGCTRMERNFQTSERDYTVTVFSGGDTVFTDKFHGIVNNSEHSDGIYYYKDDKLIEISGDYIIESK